MLCECNGIDGAFLGDDADLVVFEDTRAGVLGYPFPEKEYSDEGENDDGCDDLARKYVGGEGEPDGVRGDVPQVGGRGWKGCVERNIVVERVEAGSRGCRAVSFTDPPCTWWAVMSD